MPGGLEGLLRGCRHVPQHSEGSQHAGGLPEMGKSQGSAKTRQELATCTRHGGMGPMTRMDGCRLLMKDRQGTQGEGVSL